MSCGLVWRWCDGLVECVAPSLNSCAAASSLGDQTHPKKFGKASALVQQLVQSELQAANSDAFVSTLQASFVHAKHVHSDSVRDGQCVCVGGRDA